MVIDRSNINIMLILKSNSKNSGFTIVELLVVIVIIGILAAITIVSYSGITKKATTAVLQSDTANASQQLEIFKATNDAYPTTIDCSIANSSTNLCLKSSNGSTFTYQVAQATSPKSYTLYAANDNGSQVVMKTNQSAITTASKICPTNFVLVPGSSTYGTNDFCVMKYEARIQGIDNGYQTYSASYIAESRPTGGAWTQIDRDQAISASSTACTGCHLITNAEWMTIAQNVAGVASNWSSGVIGNGYIFEGLSSPSSYTMDASSDDSDGYYNTSYYTYPDSRTKWDYIQKRTLTLSNGQTIWDFSGSNEEWVNGMVTGSSETISSEWPDVSTAVIDSLASQLGASPSPASSGITDSSSWLSNNGIGTVILYPGTRGLVRGLQGIYGFHSYDTGSTSSQISFRAAQ